MFAILPTPSHFPQSPASGNQFPSLCFYEFDMFYCFAFEILHKWYYKVFEVLIFLRLAYFT